jgi:hypothetical protein
MIKITLISTGEDFKTADKLLKKTLETRVETISDTTGSTWMDVEECDEKGNRIKGLCYSKELTSQPAEQPRETCKWKREYRDDDLMCWSPHLGLGYGRSLPALKLKPDCPTCGKRIEVVE